MSDESSKGGLLLLLVTALVIAVSGGGLWLARESGREESRHQAEREAIETIFRPLLTEVQGTLKDGVSATSSGSQGGPSRREWTAELKTAQHGPVLKVKVRVEIEGWIRKRSTGIRVETAGLPLDAVFLRRLSEELAARGLRMSSTSP